MNRSHEKSADRSVLFILLLLLFLVLVSDLETQVIHPAASVERSVSVDSLKKHLLVLGNDSLEGRQTGSEGAARAAEYIASQFKKYNLIPMGNNNAYYQNIQMHGSIPLQDSQLRLFHEDGSIHDFELQRDYLLDKSGAQTFIPTPIPLVFVGYGINAPEFNYNDYQSVDIRGKIVVFLEGEPRSTDSSYFAGTSPTIYSLLESKQRMALARGAVGSIMVADIKTHATSRWEVIRHQYAFEDINLSYNVTGQLSIIMRPQAASLLFRDSGYTLEAIWQLAESHALTSFNINKAISFRGQFIQRDFTSRNVIALLEGDDEELKDSYILISAHYDHLGIGPKVDGDSIYNGVIDNASGVAGMLEIARVFTRFQVPTKRSILFLATTGEESGLLGALYYVDHPRVPLYKTIANINIDGLAFIDEFSDIIGIGAELSTLQKFLQKSMRDLPVSLTRNHKYIETRDSFYRSDQIAFAQGGIPSMLIMEGINWRNHSIEEALEKVGFWMNTIYHSPFDDLNQPINFQAARQHNQIILNTIYTLANSKDTPIWEKGVKYRNIRLQTIAEER